MEINKFYICEICSFNLMNYDKIYEIRSKECTKSQLTPTTYLHLQNASFWYLSVESKRKKNTVGKMKILSRLYIDSPAPG